MKIRIQISIFFIAVFIASAVVAQQKTPLRLEVNAKLSEDSYTLIPCAENGLVLFYEDDKVLENGNRNWHIALFDKQLQESWVQVSELNKGMSYFHYVLSKDILYLSFFSVEKKKSDEADFQILRIQLGDGNMTLREGFNPDKSEPTEFKIINDKAWIGIAHRNSGAQLNITDLNTGERNEVPIDIPNQNIISGIFHDEANARVNIVVQNFDSKQQSGLYYQTYDLNGNLKHSAEIKPALNERYLNTAELISRDQDIYALGTYNAERGKVPYEGEDGLPQSAGFFIAKFEGNKQVFINYYNFLEFENLYNSLSGKDIMKVRKKAEKQKDKGSEYSLNYNLLLHPAMVDQDHLILLAEALYPEYRTVTNMYYDYYGRLMPQTYTVFEGYKYFNGIIAAFDKEGTLVWDNDIEIWNVLTFDLEKYLNAYVQGRELALFYSWEGKINYKIIDLDLQTSDADQVNLELKYKKDKVLEEVGSRILHWYDNYFICFGYQEIKNNSLSKSKRSVFYVNKVAFQ